MTEMEPVRFVAKISTADGKDLSGRRIFMDIISRPKDSRKPSEVGGE